jgi:type II secretory pathway pseudopilin PulG
MKKLNYTLIEMLTVIGVAVILMSIAVPSFNRIMTGQRPKIGARNLAAIISAGRAQAITKNTKCAIICPIEASNVPADYIYRSAKIAEVRKNTSSGEYEFVKWVDGFNWVFMPAGISIMEIDQKEYGNPPNTKAPEEMACKKVTGIDFSDIGSYSTAATDRAIIYSPYGGLDDKTLYISVGENHITENSAAGTMCFKINRFTGRISWED